MKKLLICMLFISSSVMADTWVMNNNGGGQIVLTDRLCKGQKSIYYAYTHTTQAYFDGCWALLDGKVHVVWEGGQRRVYNLNDFVADEVTPKKKGTAL